MAVTQKPRSRPVGGFKKKESQDSAQAGRERKREARRKQGVVMVRGPEAAQQRNKPGNFAHKTVDKAPRAKKYQYKHYDKVENILTHAFSVATVGILGRFAARWLLCRGF